MDIDNIKQWLEKAIDLLEKIPDDIQENIKENRHIFGIPYRMREEIKEWVVVNRPGALPYLVKLNEWMVDWYHYFDAGYVTVSGETIDTLSSLILERLQFIREKIESL